MGDEEGSVSLSRSDLLKLYKYALTHCHEVCPAQRDPETCVIMFEIGAILGLEPPCAQDYGGLTEESLKKVVGEIESRYGKSLQAFLEETERRGPRNLQEQADAMDGKFALEVLKVLKKRKEKANES